MFLDDLFTYREPYARALVCILGMKPFKQYKYIIEIPGFESDTVVSNSEEAISAAGCFVTVERLVSNDLSRNMYYRRYIFPGKFNGIRDDILEHLPDLSPVDTYNR